MIFVGGIFMNVKALMCDIDGTLLSSEGVVTPKTVEMIKKQEKKEYYLAYLQEEMSIVFKLCLKYGVLMVQLI